MKSPCIAYPESEPLVLIRASQVRLCDGNHCAAALLSYFGYWHSNRLGHTKQAEHANKVAALHGESGTQDTTLMQYHTEEDIEEGLLHLYGRKSIRTAIALLVSKGFLSLHTNPNQRYRFDRTHYFLFHPEHVQAAIGGVSHEVKVPHRENMPQTDLSEPERDAFSSQVVDVSEEVKVPDREGHSASSSGKNAAWSGKNAATIPEITSEITPKEEDLPPPPQGESKRSRTKASQQPDTNYTPGFELAWHAYPAARKEGKVDAFTIWRTRDLEPRAQEIAEKIERLTVTLWKGRERHKIPLPTTWLNQWRYEDELVPLDAMNDLPVTGTHAPSFAEEKQQRKVGLRKWFLGDTDVRSPGPHRLHDRPGALRDGLDD